MSNNILHEFIFKVKNRLLRTEIKDINMHINYLNRKIDSTITELENTISKDVLDLLVKFYEYKIYRIKKEFKNKFDNKINIIQNNNNQFEAGNKCISDVVPSGWIKNLTDLDSK